MTKPSSFFSRHLNWNKKSSPETVNAEQYAEAFVQFKKLLLEQYQIRIQAKTAKRLPINLTAKPTHFGTSPERVALYFNDLTIESEDIATEIDKILNTHYRLLLIGDPGAGKTTILLFAAINILMDESREQKLPLILNLATWQKDRNFKEWYAQSIAHTYSLSPIFVEELLRRDAVMPFFDGFDEVAEDTREDFFQKMAAYFGDQRSRQLIVSSRKKEYAAAKADAPVYAEIEVQRLSLEQIKKALKGNAQTQAADRALLDAIDRDEWLGKAVETPFYLNTASFLFGKGHKLWGDFPFKANSLEGRQEELIKVFVVEQVPGRRERKHLSFLAGKMEEESFLVFELVKMQPRWVRKRWMFHLSFCFFIASVVVLAFFLANPLHVLFNLLFGFILGMELGWILSMSNSLIRTKDIQTWHWQKFIEGLKIKLMVFGPIFIFLLYLILHLRFSPDVELDTRFGFGMRRFGVLYFMFWTTLLLIGGLKVSGSATNLMLHIYNPYLRFWATFRRFFWIIPALLMAIVLSVLATVSWENGFSWEEITIWIQNPGLWLGGLLLFLLGPLHYSQFPQHFALRLVLYLENKLPLRLVTFLDRMTDQHIFEDNRRTINGKKQRGATWRFRHKILQDYFAKMKD